ncbi:hypothetical protein ABTM31_20890, partial [Acinetobacter baumannii]
MHDIYAPDEGLLLQSRTGDALERCTAIVARIVFVVPGKRIATRDDVLRELRLASHRRCQPVAADADAVG